MNLVFGQRTYDCIRQAATERQATEAPMYALETDLDRTNVSVRELDKKLDELIRHYNKHINNFNHNTVWTKGMFSNLYEDPFPPATDAEWDEAHAINEWRDLTRKSWSEADDFARRIGFYRFSAPPLPTEEEWDEAHILNNALNMALSYQSMADQFMAVFGYYRDEAECECVCCQERGK